MEYKSKKLEKNQIEVEFKFSHDEWEKATELAYEKNKGRFNIQGFRKGKAPRKVIEKLYGEGIFFDDALDEVFSHAYNDYLETEKDVLPIAHPDIKLQSFDENGLVLVATIQVVPEVTLGAYTGLEFKKNKAKIKESDVDAELERLRQKQVRFVEVLGRPAQLGDMAEIDFVGSVDGEKFEGGAANNYKLELGSHSFIDTFEDQIVGMNAGEDKVVKVKFPEGYPEEKLAGCDAEFAVTLHKIEEKELPELNDEFASSVSEFETLDDLKADIKAKLEKNLEIKVERELENAMVDKIVDSSEVEIPQILIDRQQDAFIRDFELRLQYQGMTMESYLKATNSTIEQMKETTLDQAKRQVKIRLVLEALIKKENLLVSETELMAKIKSMADLYKKDVEQYKKQLGERQIAYMENEMLMDKLFAYLKDNNIIK